jgi:hypothetical protein
MGTIQPASQLFVAKMDFTAHMDPISQYLAAYQSVGWLSNKVFKLAYWQKIIVVIIIHYNIQAMTSFLDRRAPPCLAGILVIFLTTWTSRVHSCSFDKNKTASYPHFKNPDGNVLMCCYVSNSKLNLFHEIYPWPWFQWTKVISGYKVLQSHSPLPLSYVTKVFFFFF